MEEKNQSDKFKALARELECDEDEHAFDVALATIARPEARTITHASDCAVHNSPAMKPGPCDCGATAPR